MSTATLAASALGLSRNEAGVRFPHAEDAVALDELRLQVVDTLNDGTWEHRWRVLDLDELSAVEIVHLVEQGLMTPGFADGSGEGRGFAVYGEGQASLEINGTDHFRLLGFRAGDQLASLWSLLSLLDDRLETSVSYAFDARWGYLASRPSQAGNGMRVYATLHVPALMLTGRLAGTALDLVTHGLALAPLWGGAGGVIQVSNLGRQARPEGELLQHIEEVSRGIVEKERSVRKMLLRENPIQTRDHIGRALGSGPACVVDVVSRGGQPALGGAGGAGARSGRGSRDGCRVGLRSDEQTPAGSCHHGLHGRENRLSGKPRGRSDSGAGAARGVRGRERPAIGE